MKLRIPAIAAACVVLASIPMSSLAQQGIKRTTLSVMEFPPGYQTVKGLAEITKGACAGRHTHPGIETSYILEGEGVSKVDGKPDQPYKAGDAVEIPAGVPHDGCATTSDLKILTVHVVEKGKPLGTPVP